MATPDETIWEIEPHTSVKHKILKNYLDAWFPILNKYNRRVVYLDGFSGPGRYKGGEPGSPIIALRSAIQLLKPIDGEAVFLFIEQRTDRVENLRGEIGKLPVPGNFVVHIESNQFEPTVTKILDELDKDGMALAPTFCFVDPFGFSGLPFALLERLLKHDRSEAFITFMVESINRFVTAPNEDIKRHIRLLFGTDEAFTLVEGPGDRVRNLTQLYQRQLLTLGSFVRSFEMRDCNDKVIYYLQFVTKHALGHLKMKEAMWKADSEGDFRFSDATDPAQQIMFSANHDRALLELLKAEFRGQTVDVIRIREFVRDKTAYIDKHMGSSLRFGEHQSEISVEPLKADGQKRRKNSFPDGALVLFNS